MSPLTSLHLLCPWNVTVDIRQIELVVVLLSLKATQAVLLKFQSSTLQGFSESLQHARR